MARPSLGDKLKYWFDSSIAKGPAVLVAWLGVLAFSSIVFSTLLVWLTSSSTQTNLLEQAWAFLVLALEPDAITFGPPSFRVATLVIVFTSIFVLSTLISILTTSLDLRLSELRRGRSKVIESGHSVILGWSAQVFPIIEELIAANANQVSGTVVVLGDEDKVVMQEQIRDRIGDTGNTKVVLRRGDPLEMEDLRIANLEASRSIIVLPTRGPDPDSTVIKTLLAITNSRRTRATPYHIVAELRREQNAKVAKIVAGDEVEIVQSGEFVARIIAQTCRQSGLSVVYTELMDFNGDEIYFHEEPSLANASFFNALTAYEDSAVIGVMSTTEGPKLNPAMDSTIQPGDQLIAISRDDDTVIRSKGKAPRPQDDAIVTHPRASADPERTLILGWNWKGPSIVEELDNYVPENSRLAVVTQNPIDQTFTETLHNRLSSNSISFTEADTTDRSVLEALELDQVDHVIVLACSDDLGIQESDARTLVTLLHLRDIAVKNGLDFSVVSEILDIRNQRLAQVSRADDFVVSDRITSHLLTQISENKSLSPVFEDLFGAEGSELYLKSAGSYVQLDRALDFYTVLESARRKSETAIGYRLARHAQDAEYSYGIVINPKKSEKVSFGADDRIIVLAES